MQKWTAILLLAIAGGCQSKTDPADPPRGTTAAPPTVAPPTVAPPRCREVPESYTESVPYEYTFKYAVQSWKTYKSVTLSKGEVARGEVNLSNAEPESGVFEVTFNFRTATKTIPVTQSKSVDANSTAKFTFEYDSHMGEDVSATYSVQAPTVTKHRDETKMRMVTKCE